MFAGFFLSKRRSKRSLIAKKMVSNSVSNFFFDFLLTELFINGCKSTCSRGEHLVQHYLQR